MTGIPLDVPSYSNERPHWLVYNSTRSNANYLPADGVDASAFIRHCRLSVSESMRKRDSSQTNRMWSISLRTLFRRLGHRRTESRGLHYCHYHFYY